MVKKIGIILIGFLIIPFMVGIIEARNLALGKGCTASPDWIQDPNFATDGRMLKRWESDHSDDEWIKVDLGESKTFNTVMLRWETAYGKSYTIEISDNEFGPWTVVCDTTTANGGNDNIYVGERTARYVKMNGRKRSTIWGYSLWEFEVHNIFPATNLAFGEQAQAEASSIQGSDVMASNAVDGDMSTRWGSEVNNDSEWIKVDLGSEQIINAVVLKWEAAYGGDYTIELSIDDINWSTASFITGGDGGIDIIEFSNQSARYVKMNGTKRGVDDPSYGYSLYEFEVYSDNMPAILDVAIRNIADNEVTDTITWSGIDVDFPLSLVWTVADQYLEIEHAVGYLNWGIQIYTDNQGEGANPEYTGYSSPAGLVGVTATTEVLPMCWHTEDEHVDGGPLTPVEREDHSGFTNYSWFFLGDKSSAGFNNGDDWITVWNLEGAKWGEDVGERYTPVGTVMVYLAAKFEQATIQTYKTNKFILEQYHQ
ncbi:discoidin domain-containing protein [bacterium]|nr:discoidin domain-containing protein [bacterium]